MDDASYRMLSEVLELSDCILDHYQYLCAEEFAFTYFMDAARNIVTAEAQFITIRVQNTHAILLHNC